MPTTNIAGNLEGINSLSRAFFSFGIIVWKHPVRLYFPTELSTIKLLTFNVSIIQCKGKINNTVPSYS
jgi:hypothetical protein